MHKIILQRKQEFKNIKSPRTSKIEDSTIGEFIVYDDDNKEVFKCFSCENIGPSTDTPKQDKRIIARTYKFEWTESSKNGNLSKTYPQWKGKEGNLALWVTCDEELASFRNRRILIHIGNYPQDTEGCILLGLKAANGIVTSSVEAVNTFFTLVKKVGPSNFVLEVREIQ